MNGRSDHEIMSEIESKVKEYSSLEYFSAGNNGLVRKRKRELDDWIDKYRKLQEDIVTALIRIASYTNHDILKCETRDRFYLQIVALWERDTQINSFIYRHIYLIQQTETVSDADQMKISWYENYVISKSRAIHQMLRSAWELVLLFEDRENITHLYT